MERKKLESAALNNSYLRGLLTVPLGVLLILGALTNWEWGPLGHIWVFWVSVLVAGAACMGISRYYNETYGRVTLSTSQQVRVAVATIVSWRCSSRRRSWLAVNRTGRLICQSTRSQPRSPCSCWPIYAITVGVRAHHTIILGYVLVAGLLPLWGGVGEASTGKVGLVLAGVAAVATGIFDHRALKRTFGSSNGLNLENSNVGA